MLPHCSQLLLPYNVISSLENIINMLRRILISTVKNPVRGVSLTASRQNGKPEKMEYTISNEVIDYDDPPFLPVPEYPVRLHEPLEKRKQRLLYQSRKRGMLENDLLLSTFVAKHLKEFTADQTAQYDRLINGVSNDWDIYYWATGTKSTPPEYENEVMTMLKEHVKNAECVQRIRQPDL